MRTFSMELDLKNAAFAEDPTTELARVIRDIADKIEHGVADTHPIRDYNGNTVGTWTLYGDD